MSCGQLVCMKEYGGRKGGQALHDSMHVGQTVTLDDKADSIYRTEKGNVPGQQTVLRYHGNGVSE